ncbi:MAG: glycosyltransferase family 4 protein [Candidatus Xenobia bacterium]
MRIAQVSPLFESVPPRLYGGTERVVFWLTEELVRQGHEVTLFASSDSRTSARLVGCCAEALRLAPGRPDHLVHHFLQVERVYQMADEFDVIHFHNDYLHYPISRRERRHHLTTLHGRLDHPDLVPLYREFWHFPVVSISHSQRKPISWANWFGTVYHGMPRDLYKAHTKPGSYLAFLGRFSPEKGPDRAIEIARRVGLPLKIAAKIDAADRDWFEENIRPLLAQPQVEYVGEIGQADKNEFLGGALALLFPIDWPEPFGLVMIEALACGTPVIAWNRGSVPEIMRNGVSGFTVDDIEEAVGAVEHLREVSREGCRQYFESRFTTERMAEEYLRIYEMLKAEEVELPAPASAKPASVVQHQ